MLEKKNIYKLPKLFFLIITLISTYTFIAVSSKSSILFVMYLPILAITLSYSFRIGLMAWLIILPFYSLINVLIVHSYAALIFVFYLFRLLEKKETLIVSFYGKSLLSLIFFGFLASILTVYYDHFFAIFVFILYYFCFYILYTYSYKNSDNIYLLILAIIISGLLMASTAIFKSTDVTYVLGRVGIGDSVRPFANILAISFVLIISFYKEKLISQIQNPSILRISNFILKFRLLILAILFFSLLSTVSRGVIIAVTGFTLTHIVLSINTIFKKKQVKSVVSGIFIFISVITLGFLVVSENTYLSKITKVFNINEDVFASRFSDSNLQGGSEIRQKIWSAGLNGLENIEILYGHGLLSFKDLAKSNGYDYYSHSVFLDILVSTGIFGAFVILLVFFRFCKLCLLTKQFYLISILIFIVLNYFSHGDMLANGFWITLSISLGFLERLNKRQFV